MNYFENLLRPIFEFRASLITFSLAFFAFFFKEMMLFLPTLGLAVSVFLFILGGVYLRKGFKLLKYQRGLVATEYYSMTAKEVSRSKSSYFVGLGFEWRPEHAKRFRDLSDRRNQEYLYPTAREESVKQFALLHKENPAIGWLHALVSSHSIINPFPVRQGTGTPAIHGIGMWEGERSIQMDISQTNHILVVGTTGSGKSSALMVISAQDVASGRATIAIDPKGGYKVFSGLYDAAANGDKIDQFKIIHLAFPEHSAQYNALGQYHRITEISGRIVQGVDSEGAFKDFAWLKANFIAVGLHYIGESADFEKIKYYMTRCDDLVEKYCIAYIDRNTTDQNATSDILKTIVKSASEEGGRPTGHSAKVIKTGKAVNKMIAMNLLPDSAELQTMLSYLNEDILHERKLVRNIEPILEKLTTGSISQIMVPDYDDLDSDRDIIDWGQVFNDGEVVYIGTNALGDTTISSTFLQIVLEDITNYLGSLYQYGSDYRQLGSSSDSGTFLPQNVAIHIDELSAIKTSAVANMLARVGEVGVKLRVYTQSWADLVRTFGDRETAEAAIDNFGGLMMFRVGNKNTAEVMVSRLREVGIEKEGRVYGFTDSPKTGSQEDFSSSAMQREDMDYVPLVSHAILQSLPTGHAFFLTNGSRLDKLRLPLMKIDESVAPDNVRDMIAIMKSNDAHQVTSSSYSDTWFQNTYPQFSGGSSDWSRDDDEADLAHPNFNVQHESDTEFSGPNDGGVTTSLNGSMRDAIETDAAAVVTTWED